MILRWNTAKINFQEISVEKKIQTWDMENYKWCSFLQRMLFQTQQPRFHTCRCHGNRRTVTCPNVLKPVFLCGMLSILHQMALISTFTALSYSKPFPPKNITEMEKFCESRSLSRLTFNFSPFWLIPSDGWDEGTFTEGECNFISNLLINICGIYNWNVFQISVIVNCQEVWGF